AALDDVVDLFPGEVAHVAAVEVAAGLVELEPPRVAEPVRPDRAELAGLAVERVVGRDRAVLVDAQDLPVWAAQVLGVGTAPVVADGEVELAVRAECDAAADVQQLRGRGGGEKRERAFLADVQGSVEANEVVQQVVPGVIEVNKVVGYTELRIERDSDEAPVAGRLGR